jgi:uncharacterized protein (DUF1330 family)
MKNAYLIGQITIKDNEKWLEYCRGIPATLEPWNGELVFRGKLQTVLSGNHKHTDTVVIRFPDSKALENWHSSPQYQSLIALRQKAADVDLLAYEE